MISYLLKFNIFKKMFPLILILLKLNSFLFQIIIPFSTIKDNITTEYPSTFVNNYFSNKIETAIKIGTPYQKVSLRLKTLVSPISVNSVQMGTYYVIRFNESESSSYIPLTDKSQYYGGYDFERAKKSKEIIYINDNLILNNFTFLLGTESQLYNNKEVGVLGLNIPEFDWRIEDVGFIKQLKQRDLIQKYTFFIKYNENDEDGQLIIGSFPHEIDSKKYNIKNYDDFNAEIVSSTMGLRARESYYGETLMDCEFKVELAVEDNFIRGTETIKKKLLENFFEEKITRKICDSSTTYINSESVLFYYCTKKLNLSDFKNITLFIADSELKIELNYKDLFYEYQDNYYFLMYFPKENYSYLYFRLGKILFQKHILVFNHDNKKIGYYKQENKENKKNEEGEEDEDESKVFSGDFIQWMIIIILVIVVGILSFFIFYCKPWKNRAKRANELQDDNFCYQGINSDGKININ